jgi:GTP pyrophosphokinase
VQFEVTAAERTGLLTELTAVLAHERINILGCNLDTRDAASGVVYIYLSGELPRPDLVSGIINRLGKVKHVFEVKRVTGSGNGRRK